MLLKILDNPVKYSHRKRLINRLIDINILMYDLSVSDKGGCIVRDGEWYPVETNKVLRCILKKG